jgi:Zn-dependent protease with chaperone function
VGFLGWVLLAFGTSLLASWAGARVGMAPLRAARPSTWFDRARLAFPARAASRFSLLLLPMSFAAFVALMPDDLAHPAWVAFCAALAALAATFRVRLHVERITRGRKVGASEMLRGWVGLWVVMFPHAWVAGAAVALETDRFDARTWATLAGTTLAVAGAFAGGGVALARAVGLARPASPRVVRAVEAAAAATGVRVHAVLEMDLMMANAFAIPAAGMILFTAEAVRTLDDAQLAAVARHELGHLSEGPRVVAGRMAGAALVLVALVAARPISGVLSPGVNLERLLAAALVVLAALVFSLGVVRPLARRMEERADAIAHAPAPHAPAAHAPDERDYASALERLYAANLMPAVTRIAGAHPHLYDRLVAAGAPPAWPRPAPPSRSRYLAAVLVCVGVTIVGCAAAIEITGTPLPFGLPEAGFERP